MNTRTSPSLFGGGETLAGRVVVIARAAGPNDELRLRLETLGARVRTWHTLRFLPPASWTALDDALGDLSRFDWVVFTSPRAVEAASSRLPRPGGSATGAAALVPRIAAVGAASARALRSAGWPVDLEGHGPGARGLVETFSPDQVRGRRFLFPAGDLSGSDLVDGLTALGGQVERVEAYRTEIMVPDRDEVASDLREGVDAIVFASPSAVGAVHGALADPFPTALEGVRVVAIGPTTGKALQDRGQHDLTLAEHASRAGLASAVEAALLSTPPSGADLGPIPGPSNKESHDPETSRDP
jgi:uroporphyrinogen III methyltransferase/synthase